MSNSSSKKSDSARTLTIGALLLALWGLSLGLSFVSLGVLALPAALVIATTKAGLVLWFFMELRQEKPSAIYAFVIGLVMLMFLLAFVVADVLTRAPAPFLPT